MKNERITKITTKGSQILLNLVLICLSVVLAILLVEDLISFISLLLKTGKGDSFLFLEGILTFFLYFEFISMIVKYFEENHHFPLRYFLYLGITAVIRLIIVDHSTPMDTLIYAISIFLLIVSYFILNLTPRERPKTFGSPK